jgi:hypothetical protein
MAHGGERLRGDIEVDETSVDGKPATHGQHPQIAVRRPTL